jgi:hypothetical protein
VMKRDEYSRVCPIFRLVTGSGESAASAVRVVHGARCRFTVLRHAVNVWYRMLGVPAVPVGPSRCPGADTSPVVLSWSSHPPEPDRGRKRYDSAPDGSPADVGLTIVTTFTAVPMFNPAGRLSPLFLHLTGQPEAGPLHLFGNGGPARGERLADGVEKMPDVEVDLPARRGHLSRSRPQSRYRSPEGVDPLLFAVPRQRFAVHPVLPSSSSCCSRPPSCFIRPRLSGAAHGHSLSDTLPTVGNTAATGGELEQSAGRGPRPQ